jgi:hypothetical protein
MSQLRQAAIDYVQLRRALGYQLRGYERYLTDLADDVERSGASALTIEAAVAWACKPADAPPFRWKMRLSIARGFARYLQTIDSATEVPPPGLRGVPAHAAGAPPLPPGGDPGAAGRDRHAGSAAAGGDLPHAAGPAGGHGHARRRGARA